jgi:hypothetical protein
MSFSDRIRLRALIPQETSVVRIDSVVGNSFLPAVAYTELKSLAVDWMFERAISMAAALRFGRCLPPVNELCRQSACPV